MEKLILTLVFCALALYGSKSLGSAEVFSKEIQSQPLSVTAKTKIAAKAAVRIDTVLWGPEKPFRYAFIIKNLSETKKNNFRSACEAWNKLGGINCHEVNLSDPADTQQPFYLVIDQGNAQCSSNMGIANDRSTINPDLNDVFDRDGRDMSRSHPVLELDQRVCWHPHILTHEIGHSLGLMHEQDRNDSATYLNGSQNFNSFTTQESTDFDFYSILLYPAAFYGYKGTPETSPIVRDVDKINIDVDSIGTSNFPSPIDLNFIRTLYAPPQEHETFCNISLNPRVAQWLVHLPADGGNYFAEYQCGRPSSPGNWKILFDGPLRDNQRSGNIKINFLPGDLCRISIKQLQANGQISEVNSCLSNEVMASPSCNLNMNEPNNGISWVFRNTDYATYTCINKDTGHIAVNGELPITDHQLNNGKLDNVVFPEVGQWICVIYVSNQSEMSTCRDSFTQIQ